MEHFFGQRCEIAPGGLQELVWSTSSRRPSGARLEHFLGQDCEITPGGPEELVWSTFWARAAKWLQEALRSSFGSLLGPAKWLQEALRSSFNLL